MLFGLANFGPRYEAIKFRWQAGNSVAGRTFGRVSEWLAASLEMKCRATGCEFESRALRFFFYRSERIP